MKLKNWMSLDMEGRARWTLEDQGSFTTRSAYAKLKDIQDANEASQSRECSDNGKITQMWKTIWRLKIQYKTKIFLWRLYHDALPVASSLLRRGIQMDSQCSVCGFKLENSLHVFTKCWWANVQLRWMGVELFRGRNL